MFKNKEQKKFENKEIHGEIKLKMNKKINICGYI